MTKDISVTARGGNNWKVSPVHDNFDASGNDPRSPTVKNSMGVNVSGCPDARTVAADDPFVFCPYSGPDYDVAQVTSGPFAGDWYVTSSSLAIERLGLFSRLYGPNGAVEPGAGVNFYTYNMSKKNAAAVRSLVAQIREHEKAHTDAMRFAVRTQEGNARGLIEALIAKDREGLIDKADNKIRGAARFVYDYANDDSGHLTSTAWSGRLYFWETTVRDHATGKVYTYNKWVPEQCRSENDELDCTSTVVETTPP